MTSIRRILFATDLSKASGKAFTSAVALAKANRAALTILHVVVPFTPVVSEQYLAPETFEQINIEMRRSSKRHVARLIDKTKKAGIQAAGLIVEGHPAEEIVRTARSKHVDLIVLGTHGRTGINKLFVGSVAARVVATAPCPVMTVRGS